MHRICILRLGRAAVLAGFVTGGLVASATLIVMPAHAQAIAGASVGADFRVALEPYGAWHHNRRFGDVWVPASRSRDWRPYTIGHWVYTDDYGWYWVTDDQEADWGWITYHYGRWYRDADDGWFWVPGDVWGPAWVDWRYGDQYVGWAPEPPDDVDVDDDSAYWSFVTAGDLIAPSIATVLLPFDRRAEFFRRTALVNRPVMMRRSDRRFAVDPGIPPANIAAIRGRALPTYQVRPRVLAGTAALPGAIQVRSADLRREREGGNRSAARDHIATRDIIRSSSTVRPTRAAPQLQPLGRGEVGRLGAAPPRATRHAAVEQGPAQRGPGTPSARRPQQGEQRPAASQAGREVERQRGNLTPNAPRRAPSPNQGIVQRAPAARPPANRSPAIAAPPQVNRPPAVAARPQANRPSAAAPTNRPPALAARPRSRPIAPPAAAPRPPAAVARPAPPPAVARPPAAVARPAPPPAVARPPAAVARPAPPPAAARPPAAVARPAPPPAAARPAMGAAPRGGPGQKRR
jgi:hypothetical protein